MNHAPFRLKLLFLVLGMGMVFSSFLPLQKVIAQDSSGIKIQPTLIEEKVEPGQIFSSGFQVTNLSQTDQTYYFSKRNIIGIGENGTPLFSNFEENIEYEVAAWIKFPYESVDVASGQSKEIPFTIEIPKDASPGSHFGAIFATQKPPKLRDSGAGIGFQVGTIISLKLAGDTVDTARIREFYTDRILYGSGQVNFLTNIENTGNLIVRPHGILEISNIFGTQVANLRFNDLGSAVLPHSERKFELEWKTDKFAFGRYQAIISLSYGDEEKKTISSLLSFWILPINLILPIFGAIAAIILIVYGGVKLHIRRKLKVLYNIDSRSRRSASVEGYRPASPLSKLTVIAVAILAFSVLFLLALFVFFA